MDAFPVDRVRSTCQLRFQLADLLLLVAAHNYASQEDQSVTTMMANTVSCYYVALKKKMDTKLAPSFEQSSRLGSLCM